MRTIVHVLTDAISSPKSVCKKLGFVLRRPENSCVTEKRSALSAMLA
jgi:hypothetical protein